MLQPPTRYTHFGYSWLSPIKSALGSKGFHPGLDFNYGAPYEDLGQPVYSLGNGVIEYIMNWSYPGWGKVVVIRHNFWDEKNNMRTVWARYAHLQEIHKTLVVGRIIGYQTGIGKLGKTGTSIPHLHLDIRKQEPKLNGGYLKYVWGLSQKEVEKKYANIEFIMNKWKQT